MFSQSLISRATKAFRNPALLLSSTGYRPGVVRISRAKDGRPVAEFLVAEEWDGHQMFAVHNIESGQWSYFEEFPEAIRSIEEMRWFPIRERNARRNFSVAVLKSEMEF